MEMRPAQLTGTVDQRGTRKRLLSHLGVAARSGDGSTGEANWQFHQKIRRAARSPRLMTQIKQAARVVPSNFLTLFPKHEKHSSPAARPGRRSVAGGPAGAAGYCPNAKLQLLLHFSACRVRGFSVATLATNGDTAPKRACGGTIPECR